MAFVREKITTEEDKALFNSYHFIDPLDNEPVKLGYWRIDRERNAFLVAIGGGSKYPHAMHLYGIIT